MPRGVRQNLSAILISAQITYYAYQCQEYFSPGSNPLIGRCAAQVRLEEHTPDGMAFTLYDGRANREPCRENASSRFAAQQSKMAVRASAQNSRWPKLWLKFL
jgi:hypothetical protein